MAGGHHVAGVDDDDDLESTALAFLRAAGIQAQQEQQLYRASVCLADVDIIDATETMNKYHTHISLLGMSFWPQKL
jgi:hypothetical protein